MSARICIPNYVCVLKQKLLEVSIFVLLGLIFLRTPSAHAQVLPKKPPKPQFAVSREASPNTHGAFGMSKGQFWCRNVADGPRMPMLGDADGDGHVDILSLWPSDGCVIDLCRTSSLGKPLGSQQARNPFGRNGLAAACGEFSGRHGADVLGIFADGSVRLAWGMPPHTDHYLHDDLVATIPADYIPKAPVRAVTGDFDGDGKPDVLLLDSQGHLLLLENQRNGNTLQFRAIPVTDSLLNCKQLAAGNLNGSRQAELAWLNANGDVMRAAIMRTSDGKLALATATLLTHAIPDAHLVIGHFRGAKEADLLVDQRLLPGGNAVHLLPLPNLPTVEEAKEDQYWLVGDFNGDGKDDLFRMRNSRQRFFEEERYVHYSSFADDEDKGYISTADDGLLDAWKRGKVKPGGLDLAALGCQPGHREAIVEIECFDDLDQNRLHDEMNKVIRYFAGLPVMNPDGTTGIALHVIYMPPRPLATRDQVMSHFDDLFPPVEHRGIVHSYFVEEHGPLVSKIEGDNGHCNLDDATFLHEFGHNLHLSHEAWYGPPYCAIYPSLMSYTYSYGLDDRRENIGYSDGARASMVLHEEHLSERLPFPYAKVKFLSGGPYHFHLKPTENGKATLIDWNWNGIFGEDDVRADVNYERGVDVGPRFDVGQAATAPVLVAHGQGKSAKLLLLYGRWPEGSPLPPPDANIRFPSLCTDRPGRLMLRLWQGTDRRNDGGRWSDEIALETADVTGVPSATYLNNATWIAYPTTHGVLVRRITVAPDSNTPIIDAPIPIPNTDAVEPTLTAFAGRLALLIWRSLQAPVGFRLMMVAGAKLDTRHEVSLGLISAVPVGAVEGGEEHGHFSLWVGRFDAHDPMHLNHTELCGFDIGPDNILRPSTREWADGMYATHRPTLLWSPEPLLHHNGRIYLLSGGITSAGKPWSEQYITMQTGYTEVNGGWMYRKYYDDSYTSRSAPGACWFQGNIVYALRLHDGNPSRNDVLSLGFYGTGAGPDPMGDFDDITHICTFGLNHSIPTVTQQ